MRRPSRHLLAALAVVSSLGVGGLVTVGLPMISNSAHLRPPAPPLAPSSALTVANLGATAGATNSTLCSFFGATLTSIPGYGVNASRLYAQLCVESPFIRLVALWGGWVLESSGNGSAPTWQLTNLSFELSGTGAQPPTVSFVVTWLAACTNASPEYGGSDCVHQEYWDGNVTSGALSGPFAQEYSPICACGSVPARPSFPSLALVTLSVGGAAAVALATGLRGKRTPPRATEPESPGR